MATEVNNRDDFTIKLTIKDQDGVIIPYTEIDWEAHYYTIPANIFKVECKNGALSSNCEIIDGTVNIYVDNFNWGRSGPLKRKVFVSFPNPSFPDGKVDVSTKEQITAITII
jgi:hypothetical protein